jgi:predicted transposase/invertase (TIGR01784 family)
MGKKFFHADGILAIRFMNLFAMTLGEEAVKMDPAIQAANERMVYVTGDKEAIRAYERRQMALSDYTSTINFARAEGKAEGRAEGKAEVMLEIARNLIRKGLAIDFIHETTGLDIETINQLAGNGD